VILRSSEIFALWVVTRLSIRRFGTLNDRLIGARLDRFHRPLDGAMGLPVGLHMILSRRNESAPGTAITHATAQRKNSKNAIANEPSP